jgi:GNAT superfamily N-acetyltransferase
MNKKLSQIINNDIPINIATSGFFENYPIKEFFIENNSAIILGKSDNLWMHLLSNSASELKSLLDKYHTRSKYYFSVENWMIPLILEYGAIDWLMTTHRYVLNDNIELRTLKTKTIKIEESFAEVIYENSDYREFISKDYIIERLKNDISAGIMVDDKLVAWGFTHDDGAIGFLHVLDEFRRKGFGMDILSSLIYKRRVQKRVVFGNVLLENINSIKIIAKLGFKPDRNVSWLKLR